MQKLASALIVLSISSLSGYADFNNGARRTRCNPMDLSYRFQLTEPSRREAADPTVVWFKDRYYLFASKSGGYWHSNDLADWTFIETDQIPTEEYAPCAVGIGDTLYFLASSNEKSTVYRTKDPLRGGWTVACEALETPVWDPAFFLDDDNRLYLYWGCSNENPIYGVEIDYQNDFEFIGNPKELIHQNPEQYGWEVPGDYNTLVGRAPYIEGPWLNKHEGIYYLQYAGPGTEFKSYADGVYTSGHPLGPYAYQTHNPFASKPEGFTAGAGHGSTFEDSYGNFWHIGTVTISQKHMFERRLAMFPTFLDEYGTLYTNTKYGDYPMVVPDDKIDTYDDIFPGWMLLSYEKPVEVSSSVGEQPARFMNDEDIRTYWSAESGDAGEWALMDLGNICDVHAIQVNFAEHGANLLGRIPGAVHRYKVEVSIDKQSWQVLVNASANDSDNTHVYHELDTARECRYLRITNIEVPDGSFALSGFRIFGQGRGEKPEPVEAITARRNPSDLRSVSLEWNKSGNAVGYVVSYGVNPRQMYHSYMVYGETSLTINSLNKQSPYYYTIEAFNENGITPFPGCIGDLGLPLP